MAKAPTVDGYMVALEHPLKADLERVRAVILGADPGVTEHIKWNAPSFCWNGEDRITANVRGEDALLLVFHKGARSKDTDAFAVDDPGGLLKWAGPDRALVTLKPGEAEARAADLAALALNWMRATA